MSLKTSVKLRLKPFLLLISMIKVTLKGKRKVLLRISYWLVLRRFSQFWMYFILSFNSHWNIADQSLEKELSNSCQWEIPFYEWRTVCQEIPSNQPDFKKAGLQIPWTPAGSKDLNSWKVISSLIKCRVFCVTVLNPISQRKGSYRTIICPIFSLSWHLVGEIIELYKHRIVEVGKRLWKAPAQVLYKIALLVREGKRYSHCSMWVTFTSSLQEKLITGFVLNIILLSTKSFWAIESHFPAFRIYNCLLQASKT